jgi:hypothetical protein
LSSNPSTAKEGGEGGGGEEENTKESIMAKAN